MQPGIAEPTVSIGGSKCDLTPTERSEFKGVEEQPRPPVLRVFAEPLQHFSKNKIANENGLAAKERIKGVGWGVTRPLK